MPETVQRSCPVCGSHEIGTVGPILHPRPPLVAGVEIDLGDNKYWLRNCPRCTFQFKDPLIPAEKLLDCYSRAPSDNWDLDPDPNMRQFDVLRDALRQHCSGRRVLDVGCFNGALLTFLGDEWRKFGVEPSKDAADLARQRGVDILATTLDDLDPGVGQFDAVLAIDVVEHVAEPMPLFKQFSDLLAPGGVLLILTGDNQAPAWKLQRSFYWYCSLPEHVSFSTLR